jgi:hypothetical protein
VTSDNGTATVPTGKNIPVVAATVCLPPGSRYGRSVTLCDGGQPHAGAPEDRAYHRRR